MRNLPLEGGKARIAYSTHLSEGARGRSHCQRCLHHCHRRQHRWQARGAGHGDRPIRSRDVLERIPALARAPRTARCEARRLRRAWSPSPTCRATDRRDSPYSTDRVCAERRVPRPCRPDDPCPQIASPPCKSIVFLLPFALCVAFPRSDYYGSSALGVVRLRPSRLARLRAGRAIQVPVFRSPTFVPLGGELYPGRCWDGSKECPPFRERKSAPTEKD